MIEGYGNGMLRLDGGREATVEEVLDRMIGDTCYLLQAVVRNHAQIRSYASALATVRLVNLVAGDRVTTLATALKIPGGDNTADKLRRGGNRVANHHHEHRTHLQEP